jgi:subtilisin family serine protease
MEVNLGRVGVWGVLGLLCSVSAGAAVTPPRNVARDLIVRYRQPQDSASQALATAQASVQGSLSRAEVLNGSEGVLGLHFDSAEAADQARARLELSGDVLSVSPNLLYRPAVRYSVRSVEKRSQFLTVPFISLASALTAFQDLPDVGLPPSNVVLGADPMEAQDWALPSIRMPEQAALDQQSGVPLTTAVIDTGIDYNHEDLAGALWHSPDNVSEVGWDFAHNHAKPFDIVHFDIEGCMKDLMCSFGINQGKFLTNPGHGTHCAGHVGAVANNSTGLRGVSANRSLVMGIKFFYDAEDEKAGQGDDLAAIQSIDYAVNHGVKVISASWGGRQQRSEAEKSELKQALLRAQKAGVLVVIAAGNDGIDQDGTDEPSYPAAYELDNLIVVAASDKNDALAGFSNYGAKGVHIAAPGVRILSTTSGGKYSDIVTRFKDSSGKEKELAWDGTSMATPIVAGATALVWSLHPTLSYREVRERILKSARAVPGLAGKVSTGGVLDVAAALK